MELADVYTFDLSLKELKQLGFDKKFNEAVIVFKQSSFGSDAPKYSTEERSYKVNSKSMFFIPSCISDELTGDCLDGKDLGVRLDRYLYDGFNSWKVDYCYLLEDEQL